MKLYGNNRYKKSYLVKKAPEFSNKNIEKETIIFEIKNESESESEVVEEPESEVVEEPESEVVEEPESEVVEEPESEVVEEPESTDISSNDNNDNDVIA
jgi:hypothetical protein